jgi:predicted amidohydrolase
VTAANKVDAMAYQRTLTAAVSQIASEIGDVDANLAKHLAVIDEARSKTADILLFPEVSLTGHTAARDVLRLAMRRDAPVIRQLADAAGDTLVIFGLFEEGPAAQFYNSAFAVRNGRIAFIHRKINVPAYGLLEEGKHFATGRYVEGFPLADPWRGGLLICADLWNPALVWLAALHGTTCLFVPISSAVEAVGAEFDNPGGWDTTIRYCAMMYGMPVLMSNRVGREEELNFWGGSRILDPFGRELARAGGEEQLITAELDFEAVRKARHLLPTVRDSNLSLVVREVNRLAGIIGVPDLVRTS